METKEMQDEIQKLKDGVKDIIDYDKVEEMLNNKFIEFEYEENTYKVTKPTFKQKQEVNHQRVRKFSELIKNPEILMEKDLIAIYKERGIDIEGDNKQLELNDKKRDSLMYDLGEAIKGNKPQPEIDALESEVKALYDRQQELSMKKAVLLDTSLESQLNIHVFTYMAYVITRKKIGGELLDDGTLAEIKWEIVWDNYDGFMGESEELINMAVFYTSLLAKTEASIL